MASLMESILGQLGGGGMKQLGQQLGTDEQTAGNATTAALSTLLGALSKNATKPGGAEALDQALERDHDGSILGNLGSLFGPTGNAATANGEGILKHVLGGRRQAVESSLGKATGLQQNQMGDLLKTLAPVVLGALGQQKKQRGMKATDLASMLGQERTQLEQQQPGGMNALAGLLDADGDGDVDLGDLAKQGGGLLGKFLGGR